MYVFERERERERERESERERARTMEDFHMVKKGSKVGIQDSFEEFRNFRTTTSHSDILRRIKLFFQSSKNCLHFYVSLTHRSK
jgi:hypothetical protein